VAMGKLDHRVTMNYLIEIIFEDVFFDAIGQLIRELTQAGKNITNYSLNADWEMEDKIDWHSADSINRALNLIKAQTVGLFLLYLRTTLP